MSQAQRDLSEYLQCELYHSIGAYRVAEEHRRAIVERLNSQAPLLGDDRTSTAANDRELSLGQVISSSADYDRDLGLLRHASLPEPRPGAIEGLGPDEAPWPARDPIPADLLLSRVLRFKVTKDDGVVQADRIQPWNSERSWDRVPALYATVINELNAYHAAIASDPSGEVRRARDFTFAQSVIASRDGNPEPTTDEAKLTRLRRRIARYRARRETALEYLAPITTRTEHAASTTWHEHADNPHVSPIVEIREGCLVSPHDKLPLYVVSALTEAHLVIHAVEAWQTMCLGERAFAQSRSERQWLKHELLRAIVLFTFAHSVSRIAPWIFAADDEERDNVFAHASSSWENMVPARCTWIATQIGLLALYRRGYARLLYPEPTEAYNDFHKLQRLVRDTERRILAAPTHVDGATDFLASLTAQSHHQIGELYRSEHAHKQALKHFEAAFHGVKLLEDAARMQEALANSRWHVELQVSRGKAAYEMGRHKEALCWHLHAWGRFLKLLAGDTGMEANTKEIDTAIDWLERVRFEPELRKSEVSKYLGPVVAQLGRITVSRRLGALAAEILLRLGHLLFVLNIRPDHAARVMPAADAASVEERRRIAAEDIRRTLAFDCLCKAAQCDPHSTLAGADLLKAHFRLNFTIARRLPTAYEEYLEEAPRIKPIHQHWPHGRDSYERLTRVSEYLTLAARAKRFAQVPSVTSETSEAEVDALVARHLLLDFFMSTDSTNVRKSQVHRFLMRNRSTSSLPGTLDSEKIEFVCMRRYSSAFPMLPRPSAFRALGGGYFVRLHGTARPATCDGSDAEAARVQGTVDPGKSARVKYGVVIDPGMDFVENLYRTGYSIGDIDMIIVTHDHVDHLGSLDPLFSLLHERASVLASEDGPERKHRRVEVAVSRSIMKRYKSVTTLSGRDETTGKLRSDRLFDLKCFEPGEADDAPLDIAGHATNGFPERFEIVVMSSAVGDDRPETSRGHRDLSRRPSHGVCIRVRNGGPSFAVTSDTPGPPSQASPLYGAWRREWAPALEADVLVAHVSSVPLTELRRLDPPAGDSTHEMREEETRLIAIRRRLQEAEPALEGQIDYAQWLGSGGGGHTAEIVGPVPDDWQPPRDHPYLAGTLRWAREYMKSRRELRRGGLFVIGELSEELGTMRGKLAARINDYVFRVTSGTTEPSVTRSGKPSAQGDSADPSLCALTADIGLHICVHSAGGVEAGTGPVGLRSMTHVLCATCNLDTDRVPDERYHEPLDVREVCVKGENEGIFYNCTEHNPLAQGDPVFLEQLERFDIFGR
jgi:tetratricopeptide (TPR) repeat protein